MINRDAYDQLHGELEQANEVIARLMRENAELAAQNERLLQEAAIAAEAEARRLREALEEAETRIAALIKITNVNGDWNLKWADAQRALEPLRAIGYAFLAGNLEEARPDADPSYPLVTTRGGSSLLTVGHALATIPARSALAAPEEKP